MRNRVLIQILVNAIITVSMWGGLMAMEDARNAERREVQASVMAETERERAIVKSNYKKAETNMSGVKAKAFKAHACTTEPTLTDFVMVRVDAPGDSFDPYRIQVVSFDDGFKMAKKGAWIAGFCKR